MQYRREIDGLRAVAVVPVVFYHAGFQLFSGGFAGVDVFFVISGYLITTILLEERAEGTYTVWKFYERRARRILPALFFVLICTIPFAYFWMPPAPFADYARSFAMASMFLSNMHFLEHGGYFDVFADYRPLIHTWSLAVEEQFYLLFPLVLLMLGTFRERRYLIAFLILSILSLGVAEWAGRNYPVQNFYFTPSRLWELLAGSICAVLLFRRGVAENQALAILGLGMIVAAMLLFRETTPTPSLYTLLPVVGTCLVIFCAGSGTWTGQVLSCPPFVWIGLISYSLYLWHQSLFAFVRIRFPLGLPEWSMIVLLLSSFALAWLSWNYVEQPFRGRKPRLLPSRRAIFGVSVAVIAVFATSGLWIKSKDGFPERLNLAASPLLARLYIQTTEHDAGQLCQLATRELCVAYDGEPDKHQIALLGDSHARTTVPGFEGLARDHGVIVFLGDLAGCPPLLDVFLTRASAESQLCQQTMQDFVEDTINRGVDTVVLIARWSHYASGVYQGPDPKYMLTQSPGKRVVSKAEWRKAFQTGLSKTIARLQDAGIRVVVFEQVPQQKAIPSLLVQNSMVLGLDEAEAKELFLKSHVLSSDSDRLQRESRELIAQVADPLGVIVMSFDALFENGDRMIWFDGTNSLYLDDDHLSTFGSQQLAPMIEELFLNFGLAPF